MNKWLWQLKAKLYDSVRNWFPFSLILKAENRKVAALIESIELRQRNVVDLGTGTGNGLPLFAAANYVVALDLSYHMLRAARRNFGNVKFIQADCNRSPFKSGVFDVISAIGLSEYLSDIEAFFAESFRLLKKDGFLLMTCAPPGLWTRLRLFLGHVIYPRTIESLQSIGKKKGFRVIRISASFMQSQLLFQKY